MPEMPEVEVLVRHLEPRLRGRTIRGVEVRLPRLVRPHTPGEFGAALAGRTFERVRRRAKYLVFDLRGADGTQGVMVGHLGMTGRMYLQPNDTPPPKHAAVVLALGDAQWVFEDARRFGRLALGSAALEGLGPEPLGAGWTLEAFRDALRGSRQAVKVRLLDQGVAAGVGNIYASEALHRAGLGPGRRADSLTAAEVGRLHEAIRGVLTEAIAAGSSMPLDFAGGSDGLFYYGSGGGAAEERFLVYDREGAPCRGCGTPIRRTVQAARATFHCPRCQGTRRRKAPAPGAAA